MGKHKFEMSVRSYSTVEFEIELDSDDVEIIDFYLSHSDNPTWKGLSELLPDDVAHEIDVAARKTKATFNNHEISANHSFDFD